MTSHKHPDETPKIPNGAQEAPRGTQKEPKGGPGDSKRKPRDSGSQREPGEPKRYPGGAQEATRGDLKKTTGAHKEFKGARPPVHDRWHGGGKAEGERIIKQLEIDYPEEKMTRISNFFRSVSRLHSKSLMG